MATYNPTTDFSVKDGLSQGDPEKAILGSDFDAEFNNISTAVNSKADSAGPTFTGTATFATLNTTVAFQIGGVAVTATAAELNKLDGVTASTAELNVLDGITATTAELNHTDGVTSNIQAQLDAKQASGSYLTGNETITLSGDVSGSGTTSISVTVANDSHTHNMANLTGTTYAAGSGANITNLNASQLSSGTVPSGRISSVSVTQHEAAINAGSVDGYDIVVDSGSPSGTDANTIYFVT